MIDRTPSPHEPLIDAETAAELADRIASLPPPEIDGENPPSAEFVEGFNEAKRLAVVAVMRASESDG